MSILKTLFSVLCAMTALTASAQNDSIKVSFDFDENPWNMSTCSYFVKDNGKKSWSYPSYDPASSRLDKVTTFEIATCGDKLTMTVTPSDLDETDYDNALVRDEDYNAAETVICTYLYMFTGSKMTFTAPKDFRMAKVKFNTYRSWASGGLSANDLTWGPDTAKIHIQYNDKGEETYRVNSWDGDAKCWSTPACTGATRLYSVDVWLLPEGTSGVASLLATEQKTVNVVSIGGTLIRSAANRNSAVANLPKGVYIVEGKKFVVK